MVRSTSFSLSCKYSLTMKMGDNAAQENNSRDIPLERHTDPDTHDGVSARCAEDPR